MYYDNNNYKYKYYNIVFSKYNNKYFSVTLLNFELSPATNFEAADAIQLL